MSAVKKALLGHRVNPETIFTEEFGVAASGWPSLRSSISARVYAGTAAGFVLALIMVTFIDLKSTIAKSTVTTPVTTTATTPTTSTDDSSASSSTDSTSTNTSTTIPPTTTTPTTQQSQTTYQQPVTSVS